MVALRRKGDVAGLESGGGWIDGTGRVIFRSAKAKDKVGFPGIEELWKITVILGLFPEIR